jgi:hypothetical protein
MVEHERVAPFEPRDDLVLARLFGEQVADRLLFERLRRGDAHVDRLRVGPGVAEQSRVDQVVVQNDVGHRQALHAAHGDEAGVPRAGADEIHNATHASGPPRV